MEDLAVKVEWRNLITNSWRVIKKVGIKTFNEQWMDHPEKQGFIDWKDDDIEDGKTMLLCAIEYKRLDVAKLLVEHGADVTIADKDGSTALMYASYFGGNTEVLQLLLHTGADLDIGDNKGDTPLMFASYKGNPKLVEFLVEKGAYNHFQQEGRNYLDDGFSGKIHRYRESLGGQVCKYKRCRQQQNTRTFLGERSCRP